MKLLNSRLFIVLAGLVVVVHSNPGLLNGLDVAVSSSLDDVLSKFNPILNSLIFEKIGSDFDTNADDLLRYNLGLTNEDRDLDGFQLLTKYGFTYEVHTVETSDGYLLEVVRIPGNGSVVLIVHGLLESWEDFITSGPNFGLSYLLARRGFDVWLLNCRGNKFSRNHISLSPEENEFWNFSWHEIGIRDVPATVEKILSITGKNKIIYIGHSQGTTSGFVWLSEYPEYNDKVALMICLAPVSYLNHVKSPLFLALTPFRNEEYVILNTLGTGELLAREGFANIVKNVICSNTVTASFVCSNVIFLLYGFDYAQMNFTNFLVEFSHTPSGCSIKQFTHYLQGVASGNFRQFDYGKIKNLKIYKSLEPPDYNISNIMAPVALCHGKNDWLATPTDVDRLAKKIPNLVENYLVPFDKFNHGDFLWAKDVVPLLYNRIFELIKEYM